LLQPATEDGFGGGLTGSLFWLAGFWMGLLFSTMRKIDATLWNMGAERGGGNIPFFENSFHIPKIHMQVIESKWINLRYMSYIRLVSSKKNGYYSSMQFCSGSQFFVLGDEMDQHSTRFC